MKRLLALLILLSALASGWVRSQSNDAGADSTSTSPSTPGDCWQASLKAESEKQYDDALTQVAAYSTAGGDAYMASLRNGWLYYQKQDYNMAATSYRQAAQLQTTALSPLLGLLNVAMARGDSLEIQKAAADVLSIDPSNYRGQMTVAGEQFLLKNYAKALEAYRKVRTTYPDDLAALSGEAWSLYYTGATTDAAADFKMLVDLSPNYPWAQQGLKACQPSSS